MNACHPWSAATCRRFCLAKRPVRTTKRRQVAARQEGVFIWISFALALLAAGAVPSLGRAEQPAAVAVTPESTPQPGKGPALAPAEETLRFRRIFVPVTRLPDWPTGGTKYLPVESAEFERLLAAMQRAAPAAQSQTAACVTSARYQARLEGPRLIVGEGQLQVNSTAKEPVLLPLDPCKVAITRARWGDNDGPAAVLGLNVDAELQLLVKRSRQLTLAWNLRGQSDAAGTLNFQFELPPCPVVHFEIDLPPSLRPWVDRGVILSDVPIADGRRRWPIELGGHCRFQMRLTPAEPAGNRLRLAQVRQSLTYECGLHGLEVSSQLRVEAGHQAVQQVVLDLDRPLQLVTAVSGDVPLAWSAVPSSAGAARSSPGAGPSSGEATRLVLTLPEPLHDAVSVLRLKAVAPLIREERWRLPRVVPQDVFWKDGGAVLLVPGPLVVEQLLTTDCRQTAADVLAGPPPGTASRFEYFAPTAAIDVVLAQHQDGVQSVSAIATELGAGKMTSRVATDFRTANATQFSLAARVAEPWTIDAVESRPADALEDWNVVRHGAQRTLTVRLAKPLTPDRGVRLIVVARRLSAVPGQSVSVQDLVPLVFTTPTYHKRLLTASAAHPYELKIAGGDDVRRLTVQDLDAAELDLFAEPPSDLLFETHSRQNVARAEPAPHDEPLAPGARLSLEKRTPGYAATIRSEACASGETLQEHYVFSCVPPRAARVDHLLVRFVPPRRAVLRWSLAGDDAEQQLAAHRWTAAQQAAAGRPDGEETWELTLHRPRSDPFELHATRTMKFQRAEAISLASLPDATSQQANVVVRSLGPGALLIRNRRLSPIPLEAVAATEYQTARAAYRYDPLRDATAASGPAVIVSLAASAAAPSTWVWDSELQSHYAADGTAQHVASYRLENAGGGRVEITLPRSVSRDEVRSCWVDGLLASLRWSTEQGDDRLFVDLPPGERFPCLALHWTRQGSPLRTLDHLQPPLPAINVPVLAQHWTLWLPPGFEMPTLKSSRELSAARRLSWSQRLLGVFGRAPDESLFNPLSLADWSAALHGPWRLEETRDWATIDAGPLDPSATTPPSHAGRGQPETSFWPPLSGYAAQDTPTWAPYRLEMADVPAAGLSVVHAPTLRMLRWLVFLAMLAAGLWKGIARPRWLLGVAALLAALALLSAPWCAPLLSAALLATFAALVVNWLRRPRPVAAAAGLPLGDPPSTVAGIIQIGLLLSVLSASLDAVSAAGAETARPSTSYSVLVPVDDQQRPTGGKCYLSEAFYEQLYRRAAAHGEKPQGWLIASASYRATVGKEASATRLVVDELAVVLDLQVLSPAARVRIPFRRDEVKLSADSAQLDGQAVQPEWDADGSALVLEIPEPGQYRLELTLRPTAHGLGTATSLNMAIPRLPGARLEITAADGRPALEVPSALGNVRWDENTSRWIAELGPADRLTITSPDAHAAAAPPIDVEQLLWLKIVPGSVVLDAKLKLKPAGGELRRLQLVTDANMQLLPLAGPDAPAVQVRAAGGLLRIVELEWPRPLTENCVLNARFLLTDANGVGNLRLPRLAVLDARPSKRTLAVSVDPALEHQMQASSSMEALSVPEFMSDWAAAVDNPPQAVYRMPPGELDCSIATRPRRAEGDVDQTLVVTLDREEAEVRLSAQLTATNAHLFQYRLKVPPTLAIEQVNVLDGGLERVARWTQDAEGGVTVFLTGPVAGRHTLELIGRQAIALDKELALPTVEWDDLYARTVGVQILRRPEVVVEMGRLRGWHEDQEPPPQPREAGAVRLVGAWHGKGLSTRPPLLTVRANRPTLQATQVTRLAANADGSWQATVQFRVHASGGLLDRVWLDTAAAWSDAWHVVSPQSLKIVDNPTARHRIELWPRRPIAGDYQFTVAYSLVGKAANRLAAPRLAIQGVEHPRQWFVLPQKAGNRPLAWETHAMRPGHLPDGTPAEENVYEAVDNAWQAALTPDRQPPELPHISLADIRIAWEIDGSYRGVAVFQVESGRSSDCPLSLPPGCRLIQAALGAVPLDPLPDSRPGMWRLPLEADRLPGRVEILFASRPGEATDPWLGRRQFAAPTLGDLPVAQTRWTIAAPSGAGPGVPERATLPDPTVTKSDEGSQGEAPEVRGKQRTTSDTAALWRWSLDDPHAVLHCLVAGQANSLTVRYGQAHDTWAGRWLAAAVLLASAVGIGVLWRWGIVPHGFMHWPVALGIASGLAWWFCCWPSGFGLVIILATIGWRLRTKERQSDHPQISQIYADSAKGNA